MNTDAQFHAYLKKGPNIAPHWPQQGANIVSNLFLKCLESAQNSLLALIVY